MSDISVAFLGSHPLAKKCITHLTENKDVCVKIVVTYPANKDTWWKGSLFETANELGHNVVPIEQEKQVLQHEVDYLISVYYPNIIKRDLLEHPNEYALNLHQAELPRYRGSNVFSHSILNARKDNYWKHGTTLHIMEEEVDTGDVIDRRFVNITDTDTARSLYEKTNQKSIELFQENLPKMINDEIGDVRTPQSDFDGPTYFYPKSSLDGTSKIPLSKIMNDDIGTYDLIRALDFPPHEPAYIEIQGEKVYLTLSDYEVINNYLNENSKL